MTDYNNLLEHQIIRLVNQNPIVIKEIKNPSESIQLAAVKSSGTAIGWIKNPSEQVKLEAVKKDGYAIRYIKDPSDEIKMAAVAQCGDVIRYIKNKTMDLKIQAVQSKASAIQYIKNPPVELQLMAVSGGRGYNIEFILNPSEEVIIQSIRYHNGLMYIRDFATIKKYMQYWSKNFPYHMKNNKFITKEQREELLSEYKLLQLFT